MYKGWAGVVLCCAVEDLRLIVIFFHYTGATVSCRLGHKLYHMLDVKQSSVQAVS